MSGGAHLHETRCQGDLEQKKNPDEIGDSLSGVHGDRSALRADAKAQDEARDKQMGPGVRNGLPDARGEGEHRRDEYGASPAEPPVELRGGASATCEHCGEEPWAYRVC